MRERAIEREVAVHQQRPERTQEFSRQHVLEVLEPRTAITSGLTRERADRQLQWFALEDAAQQSEDQRDTLYDAPTLRRVDRRNSPDLVRDGLRRAPAAPTVQRFGERYLE